MIVPPITAISLLLTFAIDFHKPTAGAIMLYHWRR